MTGLLKSGKRRQKGYVRKRCDEEKEGRKKRKKGERCGGKRKQQERETGRGYHGF